MLTLLENEGCEILGLGCRLRGSDPLVVFGVYKFSKNLSGMAARIEVVRVVGNFSFASLLTTVSREYMFVVIVVKVLVLVEVLLGHCSIYFYYYFARYANKTYLQLYMQITKLKTKNFSVYSLSGILTSRIN